MRLQHKKLKTPLPASGNFSSQRRNRISVSLKPFPVFFKFHRERNSRRKYGKYPSLPVFPFYSNQVIKLCVCVPLTQLCYDLEVGFFSGRVLKSYFMPFPPRFHKYLPKCYIHSYYVKNRMSFTNFLKKDFLRRVNP